MYKILVDISVDISVDNDHRDQVQLLADVSRLMKFSPKLNVLFVAHLETLQHAKQSNIAILSV